MLNTSPAPLNPFSTLQGETSSPLCALQCPQARGPKVNCFCPMALIYLSHTFPKSMLPGRQASLKSNCWKPGWPNTHSISLLNPYCCLEERVGIQDSWQQSRRGHDLVIITLPGGREENSIEFQSPSVLSVPYIALCQEDETQSSGKRTRSHISSS